MLNANLQLLIAVVLIKKHHYCTVTCDHIFL